MKATYFIARKLLKKETDGKSVSRPIVRIAVITIALALIVNLITISVVIGFQQEVRDKVVGFGAHAVITKLGENSIMESTPIQKDIKYQLLFQSENVKQVDGVAYKAGILQADVDNNDKKEIQGVVFKGVDGNYNLDFFKKHLVSGEIPSFKGDTISTQVLISESIANDLNYKIGDPLRVYFVKNTPVKKIYRVAGIYNTGMEELDKKMVVADIRNMQKLNDWGLQVALRVSDSLEHGNLVLTADVVGENARPRFSWNGGNQNYKGYYFFPKKDTTIRVRVGAENLQTFSSDVKFVDSASLKITVKRKVAGVFPLLTNADGTLKKDFLDETGLRYLIKDVQGNEFTLQFTDGIGNADQFISGYELVFNDFQSIQPEVENIRRTLIASPELSQELNISSILDNQSDIFSWLSFLDVNVWIILVLMIFIGIINMSSALLVMILVRTNFIGMMKAMGANNWFIQKTFVIQVSFLIVRALVWGNIIGVGLAFLQAKFHIIRLNPEVYYLDAVPIELNFLHILLLNLGTLVICVSALLIPSRFVAKISPVRSIKFN
ncbi:MAG TPA: FtsX-like permease family protein [Crocinitomicaceae bacterium]|nr:FtsX-like permease family protein [Crocinitomicaceae bacterium]